MRPLVLLIIAWEDLTLALVDDPIRFLDPPFALECVVNEDCASPSQSCNQITGLCEDTRADEARTPPSLPRPQR